VSNVSQPIQQGGRLGRYQLITRLATGGMAEVWLARATGAKGFQKTVVVKTILPHLADDPDFLRMFIDEALLAAALNHPNIVQIFDLGQIGEQHFIAMEFILGRTMRQVQRVLRKQRKVMPPWLVLRVAVSVCDALDYAHSRRGDNDELLGIVHRDVTPENIMISFSGVTKVVDFGIAKATTSGNVTRAGKIKGKLSYLAPEQILNAGRIPADRRTDIYALGVLLYEMLTGVRPFRAPNDMALLLKIPKEIPTAPSEIARWVPTRLSNIVMKAMDKQPANRFQHARELGEELEAFLTSVGTYPSERHVSAYMCKLFDEEERRVPIINTGFPSATGSSSSGGSQKISGAEIAGPDSAASISIEVALDQVYSKTDLKQTKQPDQESAVVAGEDASEAAAAEAPSVPAPRPKAPTRAPTKPAPKLSAKPSEKASVKPSKTQASAGEKGLSAPSTLRDAELNLAALASDWETQLLPSVEIPDSGPSTSKGERDQPPQSSASDAHPSNVEAQAPNATAAEPQLELPSIPVPSVPTLSMPTPSVSAPSVSAPSVPAPSVPAPSVPAPSVPAPSVPAPSVPAPSVPTPSVPAPPVALPAAPASEGPSTGESRRDLEAPGEAKREAPSAAQDESPRASSALWVSKPSKRAAWDAVVERTKIIDVDADADAEVDKAFIKAASKNLDLPDAAVERAQREASKHAWDAVVTRAHEVEVEANTSSRDRVEDETPSPSVTRDHEKLHMWDAFIKSRVDARETEEDEAGESSPLFEPPRREKRGTSWWTGRGDQQAQAAASFDEGLELVRKGRREEALLAWEKAVALDPENRRYQGNLRMLRKSIGEEEGR
jgi:eukaryotic-like serine/threonine-protein kinase